MYGCVPADRTWDLAKDILTGMPEFPVRTAPAKLFSAEVSSRQAGFSTLRIVQARRKLQAARAK